MQYNLSHVTRYEYADAVSVCHNMLHLAPRTGTGQTLQSYQLVIDPVPAHSHLRIDYYGNQVDYFSIQSPHHRLVVTSRCRVTVDRPAVDITQPGEPWPKVAAGLATATDTSRLEIFQLSLPSKRVNVGDEFRDYAAPSFTPERTVAAAVRDLTTRIHNDFEFDSRATTVNTPPHEFLKLRRGVCQDFAHLAIACVRSMGLAARYVSGYLRTTPPPGKPRLAGADASHAWLSVWCGELGWVDFDPTNNMIVAGDHITVAWGRDYDDVCPIQGVFLGGGSHSVEVAVDVVAENEAMQVQQQSQQ